MMWAPQAFRDATLRMYMMTLNFYCAAPMSFSRYTPPASKTASLMLQGAHAVWLNEPKASASSEGFPVREYFRVPSLNSKWVEIVSEATQMHNGLKSFLKAQFTMR